MVWHFFFCLFCVCTVHRHHFSHICSCNPSFVAVFRASAISAHDLMLGAGASIQWGGGTNLTLGKKRPRGAASCLLSLYLSQMKTPPQRGSTALALINTLLFTTARTHTIGSVDHFPIFGNNLRARNNEVKTTVVLLRAKQIGIVPTLYFWSAKSIFVGNHTSCG